MMQNSVFNLSIYSFFSFYLRIFHDKIFHDNSSCQNMWKSGERSDLCLVFLRCFLIFDIKLLPVHVFYFSKLFDKIHFIL